MLCTLDPFVEILLGKAGILERKDGFETLLESMPPDHGTIFSLNHRQAFALLLSQICLVFFSPRTYFESLRFFTAFLAARAFR